MFSELDQKLIDALYFHQFDEAERLIARGADINAYSRADDDIDWDESLLSEALYCDSENLSVATFALKHGLDPNRHKGDHIRLALANFVYFGDWDEKFLAFKLLVNSGVDLTGELPSMPWTTLPDRFDNRIGDELTAYGDQEAASRCAIYRDIVLSIIRSRDYESYRCIADSCGYRVNRVLLLTGLYATSTPTLKPNFITLAQDHYHDFALDLGDVAFIIMEGHHAYLAPPRELYFMEVTDVSTQFPSIIGATITDAFFPAWDGPHMESHAFATSVLFDNQQEFAVELSRDHQIVVASVTEIRHERPKDWNEQDKEEQTEYENWME